MPEQLQKVDHSALRANQTMIIGLLIGAFVSNASWLVALVALVMAYGTARGQPGFKVLYTRLFQPLGVFKPDVLNDNPEPHLFAQGLGSAVLFGAVIVFWGGAAAVGWGLAWLVIALAALNLFAGMCVGCAIYYWLNRLHIPGFTKAPPPGTFPGMRPKGA